MIPRHSLPFGIDAVISALITSSPAVKSSDFEKAYAEALGIRDVILLPRVRSGINIALRALHKPGMLVVSPAYTCHSVHEAIALSGSKIRIVDSAPSSLLMEPDRVCAAVEPECALVLSEICGIGYDCEMLHAMCRKVTSKRIFDMAMSIPSPERMQRLETGDVALFSFGWGKPMFAGWGGIACFQDALFASRVREIRNRWASPETIALRARQSFSTLLQVTMNHRRLYGLSHERHFYRMYNYAASLRKEQDPLPIIKGSALQALAGCPTTALSPEWTRPMGSWNRKLALYNLCTAAQNADLRRHQAEMYSKCLTSTGIVRGPRSEALPQSHFPVRVHAAVRNALCDYLRGHGIDTSTLFQLPARLARDHYPHAVEASDEVLALPLGPGITFEEVRMVSDRVKDGLRKFGCQ